MKVNHDKCYLLLRTEKEWCKYPNTKFNYYIGETYVPFDYVPSTADPKIQFSNLGILSDVRHNV